MKHKHMLQLARRNVTVRCEKLSESELFDKLSCMEANQAKIKCFAKSNKASVRQ